MTAINSVPRALWGAARTFMSTWRWYIREHAPHPKRYAAEKWYQTAPWWAWAVHVTAVAPAFSAYQSLAHWWDILPGWLLKGLLDATSGIVERADRWLGKYTRGFHWVAPDSSGHELLLGYTEIGYHWPDGESLPCPRPRMWVLTVTGNNDPPENWDGGPYTANAGVTHFARYVIGGSGA